MKLEQNRMLHKREQKLNSVLEDKKIEKYNVENYRRTFL